MIKYLLVLLFFLGVCALGAHIYANRMAFFHCKMTGEVRRAVPPSQVVWEYQYRCDKGKVVWY